MILDIGGTPSLARIRRALTPEGRLVIVAPGHGQWVGPIVRILGAMVTSRFGNQKLGAFLAQVSKDDLLTLKELIEGGKLRPVIDHIYPFDEIPDAVRRLESGRVQGKVVIGM